MRGKTETPGDDRGLDLDLRQGCDQGATLQPLFQSPGGVLHVSRLDDEKERGVEAERAKARPVRAPPFTHGVLREAPQHEVSTLRPRRFLGDHGKGEGECRRPVAISFRLDLVEPPLFELVQG